MSILYVFYPHKEHAIPIVSIVFNILIIQVRQEELKKVLQLPMMGKSCNLLKIV